MSDVPTPGDPTDVSVCHLDAHRVGHGLAGPPRWGEPVRGHEPNQLGYGGGPIEDQQQSDQQIAKVPAVDDLEPAGSGPPDAIDSRASIVGRAPQPVVFPYRCYGASVTSTDELDDSARVISPDTLPASVRSSNAARTASSRAASP